MPRQQRCSASFLRNNHLGSVGIRLDQNEPQRFRASSQVTQHTFPVAILIVARAGIGVGHAVPKRVVEQSGDLTRRGGDRLGFSNPCRQPPVERAESRPLPASTRMTIRWLSSRRASGNPARLLRLAMVLGWRSPSTSRRSCSPEHTAAPPQWHGAAGAEDLLTAAAEGVHCIPSGSRPCARRVSSARQGPHPGLREGLGRPTPPPPPRPFLEVLEALLWGFHSAARALRPGGDRLVARETAARAGIHAARVMYRPWLGR